MSKHLSVPQTLELLERLRGAITGVAAQARQMAGDFHVRRAVEAKRFAAETVEERARLETELQQARLRHQAAQDGIERWFTQRKQRLQKAQRGARKSTLDRIELEEGRNKYAVQKGTLETEREQKEANDANDRRYQEVTAQLAVQQETFATMEAEAAQAFRGYGSFRQALAKPPTPAEPGAGDENQLLVEGARLAEQTGADLKRFQKLFAPAWFRRLPLWLGLGLAALLCGLAGWLLPRMNVAAFAWPHALGVFVVIAVLLGVLYVMGQKAGAPLAAGLAAALARARKLHARAHEKALARHAEEAQRIATEAGQRMEVLTSHWNQSIGDANDRRDLWPKLMEEKAARASRKLDQFAHTRMASLEAAQEAEMARLQTESESRQHPQTAEHERREARMNEEEASRHSALETEWRTTLEPLFAEVQGANKGAASDFPEWKPEHWKNWQPPALFGSAAPFGHLQVDLAKLCGGLPEDPRFALPGPARFTLPLVLTYPSAGSLLMETAKTGSEAVADTFNQVLLRLLAATPPGKVNITIIDPVRLGQSFAGVMHLADFEENLINHRIWTQPSEIEQRLADLSEHMEKVIQMYLRNEYATIAEYNAQAGNIAEKYHFLVLADFPANFSDTALRRLVNIASSGARCGVYTLVHWDRRQAAPPEFVADELRKNSVVLVNPTGEFTLGADALNGVQVVLTPPPPPELSTEFLQRVGVAGKDSGRVQVPFAQVAPEAGKVWSLETVEELRVPIGRTGATKLQYFALGKGTRQHALVAGKTGSGKSTLFHVLINNLALWCGPDQVEFYLVDFKKGVEFKCYGAQRLPHARVVAIESDREFGLSVLQRVDDELRRRGDLFRQLGVQDLAGYRRVTNGKPMPRSLLLIDEFQEFFVEDDRVSQTAAVLLDRIVRQGRAFGIHVVLGSQTLGGAYTLARTTLGQMVVRIALQCNEADAFLIMDDNNPAPRLLTRPGEGIYNDMAGMIEGNSPFQTVWLDDEERDTRLAEVRRRAEAAGQGELGPFVFEGNAPANVMENAELRAALSVKPTAVPATVRLWLGAPNAIKGPTATEFRRQSGNHLLVVGQREDAELAIIAVGLIGLAAQFPAGAARFWLLESTAPESSQREYLQKVATALPHPVSVGRAGELTRALSELGEELKRRTEGQSPADAPALFLFIHGLQNFKKLKQEDEFSFSSSDGEGEANPANLMKELLTGGPSVGIHVIATCDNYNNVNRYLGRKPLGEFERRVLFQMSANDSSSLIDSPKANTLGMNRALFFNEQEGWLETFRPYALPPTGWVEAAGQQLAARGR